MPVRIIEIECRRIPSRAGLPAGSRVRSDGLECRAVRGPCRLDSLKYLFEFRLRHGKCIVLKSRRAPGRQLQLAVRAGSDSRERPVRSFCDKSQYGGVERHAGREVVYLQDEVVDGGHGVPPLRLTNGVSVRP